MHYNTLPWCYQAGVVTPHINTPVGSEYPSPVDAPKGATRTAHFESIPIKCPSSVQTLTEVSAEPLTIVFHSSTNSSLEWETTSLLKSDHAWQLIQRLTLLSSVCELSRFQHLYNTTVIIAWVGYGEPSIIRFGGTLVLVLTQ